MFFLTFYFVLGYNNTIGLPINKVVIVSGEQWRDSVIHIQVSIVPQTPLPSQPAAEHWSEFHVLYSRSLLVIHVKYSSVSMSIPNSLIIHTFLSKMFLNEGEISYDIPFRWNLKRNYTNELTKQKDSYLQLSAVNPPRWLSGFFLLKKQTYICQEEEIGTSGRSCTHCYI